MAERVVGLSWRLLRTQRLQNAAFAAARVQDRLLMYEWRIESSLYRTMAELRREREARAAAEPEEAPRSAGDVAAGEEPAAAVELASFGKDAKPERVLGVEEVSNVKRKITPYGVTTNEIPHSDALAPLCKTNPILPGGGARVLCDDGMATDAQQGTSGKTKPMADLIPTKSSPPEGVERIVRASGTVPCQSCG